MKNRRYYLKFLVHSFGLLSLPLGTVEYLQNYGMTKNEKPLDALEIMENLVLQKQKTCVYFAGSHTNLNDLFTQKPNLVSNKIYINDDPNIVVDEILAQLNQLIVNNIYIDYVFIQNNYLKINPNFFKSKKNFKIFLFSEGGLDKIV